MMYAGTADDDEMDDGEEGLGDIDPKIEVVYKGVGRLLTRYK